MVVVMWSMTDDLLKEGCCNIGKLLILTYVPSFEIAGTDKEGYFPSRGRLAYLRIYLSRVECLS